MVFERDLVHGSAEFEGVEAELGLFEVFGPVGGGELMELFLGDGVQDEDAGGVGLEAGVGWGVRRGEVVWKLGGEGGGLHYQPASLEDALFGE